MNLYGVQSSYIRVTYHTASRCSPYSTMVEVGKNHNEGWHRIPKLHQPSVNSICMIHY